MRKIRSLVVFMLTFFMGIMLFACAKTSNYKFSNVEWKEDGSGATVILVDESDSSNKKEVSVEVTLKEHKNATCDDGPKDVYTITYEGVTYTKEIVTGKALGHEWEFKEFEWSSDFKTAKAVLVCKKDNSHTKKVDVTVTSVKKADPKCEEKGVTTYTATYETHTESKDVADIDELGHNYQFDHFSWNDDYTATAILVCQNDFSHIKEKNAVVTSKVITPATCEEKGLRQYTATYLTYIETKDVEIEALGHNYQFDHFNWAEDNESAVAVLVCKNNASHTKEEAATVTSIIKTPATCEANGITTYTATYETHTESKDVSNIEKIGHKFEFNHFVWAEDYKTAKAVFVCENDSTHTKEESVNVVENQFDTYNSYTVTYGDFSETRKVSKTSEEIYTVDFRNANNELISTADYKSGENVVIPENPTMDDEIYTYKFVGWDKEVSLTAQGSVTYKAVYEKTLKEYEIIFETEDHKEISKAKYHYGDDIVFPTENPEKEADSKYTYLFAGWNQMPTVCYGNRTYTAMYRPVYIEYEITFVNFDDKEISTKKYHYDDVVVVPTNPTKPADNTYTYEFKGWDSEVVNVNGNKVYKAEYKEVYIEYVVEFVDAETKEVLDTKTYHYNDELVVPTTFTKEADNTYTYEFDKINDEVASNVTSNLTYTVKFKKTYIDYEVKFVNYNNEVILTLNCNYGDTVRTPITIPQKKNDNTYIYVFAGWDQEVIKCDGNKTYTATFKEVYIEYDITFLDYDGSEISVAYYHYLDEVVIPEDPVRPADNTYTYKFVGWDNDVLKVYGATAYKAVYEATYIEYEIAFVDYNDKELSKTKYHYGAEVNVPESPTRPADNTYTYEFAGWDSEITKVEKATTYKAEYKETYIEYEVTFVDYDDTVISKKNYHYGDDVFVPSNPDNYKTATTYYEFASWDSEISKVEKATTYKACYNATARQNYTLEYETFDKIYDNKPIDPVYSVVGDGEYVVEYTLRGKDEYTTEAPSELGEYTIRFTFEETNLYLPTEIEVDFEIAYEINTFVFVKSVEAPSLFIELDRFGKIEKVANCNDLGYVFINECDIIGKTASEFIKLYDEYLKKNGYIKLNDYYAENDLRLKANIEITRQPQNMSYLVLEVMNELSSIEGTISYYVRDLKISLSSFFQYYPAAMLGCKTEEDYVQRLDLIISNLAKLKSSKAQDLFRNRLNGSLVLLAGDYYYTLLSDIDNNDDAEKYMEQLDSYVRDIANNDYFNKIISYHFNPYYLALETQNADSFAGLLHAVNDFSFEICDIVYNSYLQTANFINEFATHYNYDEDEEDFNTNQIAFLEYISDPTFKEFIKDYFDEAQLEDFLYHILNSDTIVNSLIESGYDQNVYCLDQFAIGGTNKYYYVDEYAGLTYIFNVYKLDDEDYYIGYIIDGVYDKDETLDSKIEKRVLDIFTYEDENGYIEYTNYKGFHSFEFNFKKNKFETCEGELVYVAYSYDLEGRPYTFRLNKDGDNLISYMYYGHWTKEELIKRVSEPCDDHFGEDSLWYYEDGFVIIETGNSKMKYVVDSDDYILKEYQLEFDYDDLVINFYHKDDIYVFAFVTIDNEKYVFYYPIDTTYDDIKGGLVTPVLGLNGTINWKVNDGNIISVSYDDYVYVITAQGLVKKDGDETYYTKTVYTFEDGNDKYDLILNVRYNGQEFHYVEKNGERVYYSWEETKTSIFVTEDFEIKYMFTKTDNGLVELDYADATKVIIASGYDLNKDCYIIIYTLNGLVVYNIYAMLVTSTEYTFATYVPSTIYTIVEFEDNIFMLDINHDHRYFELNGNEINEVAPEDKEIVTFKNYDGTDFYKVIVNEGQDVLLGYCPIPTKPYDETYYYCFEGWNLDNILGGRTFVAQYGMFRRDKTVIVTDGYIDYAYDGKEVQMPAYQTNSDGKAAIYYKLIDADDDTYTLGMPKEVGRYYVKLVIEGTEHYLENYKIIELDIELPTKQYVMFHYLTFINLLVDETGYVVDTNTLDQVLNPVLEEACVIGLTIEEATRALVNAYDKLGLFALRNKDTEDDENLLFWVQVFSYGNYPNYFNEIIKNAADEELEALDLEFECLLDQLDVKEKYLPNFTLLSENEIDDLDQYETIEYFLDNCLLTTYYSYGFNEYVVNLEPIYTFYTELGIISNSLEGYSGEAYDALKNAITSVITILNESMADINAEAAKVLKNDSKYFYLRNDFYNALNTYMEAYQNDDHITLQLMPPLGIMEFFDDMMNSKNLEVLFAIPTINAKALRASLFASSTNVALMEEALAKYDYTFDSIHELAQNQYRNYIDIMGLSFDYDLEEMLRDANLINDKGIAEFYLMNDLEDETWIFVDLSEYDALKDTGYEYICYVYEGQFTLGQYNYIDAKLLRFFRYYKDWDNKNQYYEIEICDYSNLFTSMLKAYKDKQEIQMPELGRGDLKHVAHMEMSNMIMTFGLFNDDGDKVAFAYMGNYTFDDVLNGRVSMPSETIFNWSSKDGKYTVFFEFIMYTFIEDENDSRLLVANELVMNNIELKYSRKEDAIIYAYIVADGNNYVLAYMGNATEEDIESGEAKPVLGNGGTLTWEIINDNALISYIGEDVYSAHYVTYDEQNKEYKFDRIDRYDLKSYKVAYTYTNDTYSYLLLNGLSYYGNTFHDAYRFDGVLTLEEMLESFGKPNDSKYYMWSEYDNSVVLDDQGKVVKVFVKNNGKLQEVEEKSKQIVTLNYSVTLYLIVDEFGIVTNAYGEDEYSNYFLNNHDLEGIYLKDAIIEFLNGLNDDGYFVLAKDIFQQQKDYCIDTVKISSTIDNNMTADIEAVMETIRDDINISWSVFDPRSNLTAITINNTVDVSKMTLEEATKELIHRYEIASKYTTAGFKYYALYYKDIYEFVSLLNKYKTALTAMTTDSSDKYSTALTKVETVLDAVNNYKGENGWANYVYFTFLTAASPYLYERNEIYNDIIALLKSIQNNNEYEINSADYDKIFGENFAQNEFRAQMIQFSEYLDSVEAIKIDLYDDLGLDIINDIYSYIYANGGTTLDTILSSIEEAYINELDIYAGIADINVLESNADFILRYNDVYVIEYIYHDGYANETWVFAKWEDNESTTFYDEYGNVYSVCYVFEGLYNQTELASGSIEKHILRFAEYQKDVFGNIRVTGPYMCNEVVFNIDENDTLSLTEPEGNLEYVAHFKYAGATFTFGFYDDGKAYQYYGEYSYKELKSRRVKVWNSGYTWNYYGEADLYSLSAIGTEVIFYLDDDGYLYEYVVDFSDINITYLVPFGSVTLVFSTDDKDNQYAYVFNGIVDEDTIKAGNAQLVMGGVNNLGWYGDESCLVMTLNGEVYRVVIYKEGNYSVHDPNEVTDGDYYYAVINDDYSLLFTLVETILGEEKFNVYEYPVGTTLDEMLNAYRLAFNPGCEAVYGWKATDTDVYVYNYSNNEIIMKFTIDNQDLKAYELNTNTRSYKYIYFDENDNTYACYIVNSFKICYFFDREVLYTELNENLANYTCEYLWDEDVYGRITLADFKNYFELASVYGSALVEVVPLEFNEDPTIDYVLLDKDYNMTYILFEADGYNYTYLYEGRVTSKEFGKVEPVRGIKGDVSWYLEDNKILITYQSQTVKTAVYKNGEYAFVSLNDIASYEIKYIYLGEEDQDVFVEAVTYGEQSIYDVLSWPLDVTVEQIELKLYDYYNPGETVVIGKIAIDFTWIESDSSVAVIMSQRKQAPVISDKYLKQENSIYLTDYEVKTQELKYTYSDDEYIYMLYIENGLMICYSYDKNNQEGDIVNSYCWYEYKGWGVIITIDAFTDGEVFVASDTDPTILVLAGKDSGTPIVTPISGGELPVIPYPGGGGVKPIFVNP